MGGRRDFLHFDGNVRYSVSGLLRKETLAKTTTTHNWSCAGRKAFDKVVQIRIAFYIQRQRPHKQSSGLSNTPDSGKGIECQVESREFDKVSAQCIPAHDLCDNGDFFWELFVYA